ncbi:hypothetical protein D357_00931 [Enterococcus faecium SD3B-2]|nr:hypothetical protein D357_00931 [Enterococcus faecium SD3B-2]
MKSKLFLSPSLSPFSSSIPVRHKKVMSLVFDFVDSIRKQFIKPPLNKKNTKITKIN